MAQRPKNKRRNSHSTSNISWNALHFDFVQPGDIYFQVIHPAVFSCGRLIKAN